MIPDPTPEQVQGLVDACPQAAQDAESVAPKVSRGTVSAIMAEIAEQLETVARPDWTVPEVRSVVTYIGILVDDLLEELDPTPQHNDGSDGG